MRCEKCHVNPATIHLKKSINGVKEERNLCEDCMKEINSEEQSSHGMYELKNSFFGDSFFANDFFTKGLYNEDFTNRAEVKRCPHCGMSFSDFNRIGRFGCGRCYEALEAQIRPLVQQIQGTLTYEGRVPKKGSGAFTTRRQVKRLQQELDQAIRNERFEEAVRLRDEIKRLESMVK